MKRYKLLFALLAVMMFCCFHAVSADPLMDNPSVYSFSEIVQKLADNWSFTPAGINELMEFYPDYVCRRSYDIISCQSCNNRYSKEIRVSYEFTSELDTAELESCSFVMRIDSQADVQKTLECFWLPGMKVLNISGAAIPEGTVTLYFGTENISMRCSVSFSSEGKPFMLMVDMAPIRG